MGLADEARYFKCTLCGSLFLSPAEANKCCKRAKAQVLCSSLRKNYDGEKLEQSCNIIRASVFGESIRAVKKEE